MRKTESTIQTSNSSLETTITEARMKLTIEIPDMGENDTIPEIYNLIPSAPRMKKIITATTSKLTIEIPKANENDTIREIYTRVPRAPRILSNRVPRMFFSINEYSPSKYISPSKHDLL